MTNVLNLLFHRIKTYFGRNYKIGLSSIYLPSRHQLDWYKLRNKRYNEPIADIAKLLVRKYKDLSAIDIGANIGDTAAQIAQHRNVRILCVEGDPIYSKVLRRNMNTINAHCEHFLGFVGSRDEMLCVNLTRRKGTSTIRGKDIDVPKVSKIRMSTLRTILEAHPNFWSSKLLKIDTDGYDARILSESIDVIAELRAAVFFEADPSIYGGADRAISISLHQLRDIGYNYFHIYDNFGNQITRLSGAELNHMEALMNYAKNTRMSMRPSLFYFDVCALLSVDGDISELLMDSERSLATLTLPPE